MDMVKKKDINIQVIRVVAMLLIITTHLVGEIDRISFLAQIINSAIYTFLFISGILFGKYNINNPIHWFQKRIAKILSPVYVFMVFLFLMRFIMFQELDLKNILIYIFNLQGFLGGVNGATHLWFTTTIMICYLITPLLQKICSLNKNKVILYFLLLGTLTIITSIISEKVGQNIFYVIVYSLAYVLSNKEINFRTLDTRKLITFTCLTIMSLVLRFVFKRFFDDTFLYNVIIVSISQATLGVYIFAFLDRFDFSKVSDKTKKLINHFDKISYEMFITHYAFITGPFYIWGISNNVIIDSILVLIATYISANILKYISDSIILKTSIAKI